jgi:SOS-response transcriptional repressor LexA
MMAARLGNIKDALSLFLSAESKFNSYMHQRSVTQWMLGCIYWTLSETVDGITYWENAITGFKQRQEKCKNDGIEADWYKARIQKSENYLSVAIDLQALPTLAEEAGISGALASPALLQWNAVPVLESVPAGGFGPAPESRTPARLEIDEVLIDGRRYQAFSVHQGQRAVRLGADKTYLVVKITGESMSNAYPIPIENGDYALLHRQENAQEQDIVIAEIYGQNARATLKRFSKKNNKVAFKAEPKNPKYHNLDPEREMDEFDDGYRIDGIVDAVFKPKKNE